MTIYAVSISELISQSDINRDHVDIPGSNIESLLEQIYFADYALISDAEQTGVSVELLIKGTITFGLPGVSDVKLTIGQSDDGFTPIDTSFLYATDDGFTIRFDDISFTLTIPRNLIDPSAESGAAETFTTVGSISYSSTDGLRIEGLEIDATIPGTGFGIVAQQVTLDLGSDPQKRGVYIEQGQLTLPDLLAGIAPAISIFSASILPESGFSGFVTLAPNAVESATILGYNFTLDSFDLEFKDNSLTENTRIAGSITLPALDLDARIEIDNSLQPTLTAEQTFDNLNLTIGSSLAQLAINTSLRVALSTENGLEIHATEAIEGELALDLFSDTDGGGPIVGHSWSTTSEEAQQESLMLLPFSIQPDERPLFTFSDGVPHIPSDYLEAMLMSIITKQAEWQINEQRTLDALAAPLLGLEERAAVKFGPTDADNAAKFQVESAWNAPTLSICLAMDLAICKGIVCLHFTVGNTGDGDDLFALRPGLFRLAGGIDATFIVEDDVEDDHDLILGEILQLSIPRGTVFRVKLAFPDASVEWLRSESRKWTNARPTLRLPPGKDSFVFELSEFKLHSGGINLRGAIRADLISLGKGAGFDGQVAVIGVEADEKGDEPGAQDPTRPLKIGEIKFHNSQLVGGSCAAVAKLPYFDDGEGTLTLLVEHDTANKAFTFAGTFTLAPLSEIHIEQFYTTWDIRTIQFSVAYKKVGQGRKWSGDGKISGAVQFVPPNGRDSGSLGVAKRLFEGLRIEFEELSTTGLKEFRFAFPPKTFEIADIIKMEIEGLALHVSEGTSDRFGALTGITLLGSVTMERLVGLDASLKITDITIASGPKVTVGAIGGTFTTPDGSLHIAGEFSPIKSPKEKGVNPQETGIAGAFSIKSKGLPPFAGLVKLTRIYTETGASVPSFAFYGEKDDQTPLLYGFYLRKVGIGAGVRQALRGLEPNRRLSLEERVKAIVDDPAGLPDPGQLASWQPVLANNGGGTPWMLVVAGQITYGNDDRDRPHIVAGSLILTIDQNFTILLMSDLWFFAAPNEIETTEFARRPAVRGTIAFDPSEPSLFAYVRTLPNPKLGKDTPDLLATILGRLEATLKFRADTRGTVVQLGWPWELRFPFEFSPYLRGEIRAGILFGLYDSDLIMAQNFLLQVALDLSYGAGFHFLGAKGGINVSVSGRGHFQTRFAGLLENGSKPYLLGDVEIHGELAVSFSWHLSLKLAFVKLKWSGGATIKLVLTAAVKAAMSPKPDIGFSGTVAAEIPVRGRSYGAPIQYAHNTTLLDEVEARLAAWQGPSIDGLIREDDGNEVPVPHALAPPQQALPTQQAIPPQWEYTFRRLTRADGVEVIRVLFFPAPGVPYPPIANDAEAAPRFQVQLQEAGQGSFNGFVAATLPPELDANHLLQWDEAADEPLYTIQLADVEPLYQQRKQELTAALTLATTDEETSKIADELDALETAWQETKETPNVTLRAIIDDLATTSDALVGKTEVVDQRRFHGATSPDADDADITLASSNTMTLPLDTHYDDLVLKASQQSKPQQSASDDDKPLLPVALLLLELLELLKDPAARTKEEPAGGTHQIARHMHLVLEFDLKQAQAALADDPSSDFKISDFQFNPVPFLIDTGNPNADAASSMIRMGGTPQAALFSPQGTFDMQPLEYDLRPGAVTQPADAICLTWELQLEDDAARDDAEPDDHAARDSFVAYRELDEFVVTRTVLTQSGQGKRTAIRPCWLVPNATERVRPAYQFVDNALEGINEGDDVEYQVVASSTDRPLASFRLNITRCTVKRLPALAQPLALNHIQARAGAIVGGAIDLVIPCDEQSPFTWDELRLRARFVPAPLMGSYGFDRKPLPPAEWIDAFPRRAADPDFPNLRFATISAGRPLPWSETEDIGLWLATLIELLQPGQTHSWFVHVETDANGDDAPADPAQPLPAGIPTGRWLYAPAPTIYRGQASKAIGYQIRLPWNTLLDPSTWPPEWDAAIANAPGDNPPSDNPAGDNPPSATAIKPFFTQLGARLKRGGMALELHIGRERHALVRQQSTERSALAQCRHAVAAEVAASASPLRSDGTLDLTRGNTVDALEWITPQRTAMEFIDPQTVQIEALVPATAMVGVEAPDAADAPSDHTPLDLSVRWRHDLSHRGGYYGGLRDTRYAPVIGYRLHRIDLYDPKEYPLPAAGVRPNALVEVRALPEAHYRTHPATIHVQTLQNEPAPDEDAPSRATDGTPSLRGDWAALWPSNISPDPRPDAFPHDESAWTLVTPTRTPQIDWPATPIWLHSAIYSLLETLLQALGDGHTCRLILRYPFVDKIAPIKPEATDDVKFQQELGERVQQEFVRLTTMLALETDPYGWWSAEALGLSCQCQFFDGVGQPVPAEMVEALLQMQMQENAAWADTVKLCFFYAADQMTLLSVIRIVHRGRWLWEDPEDQPESETQPPPSALQRPLITRAVGRARADTSSTSGPKLSLPPITLPESWAETGTAWVDDQEKRQTMSRLWAGASPSVRYRHDPRQQATTGTGTESAPPHDRPPVAMVDLPIKAGVVAYRLPVPDRLAHQYLVGVETVRRFDQIWTMIQPGIYRGAVAWDAALVTTDGQALPQPFVDLLPQPRAAGVAITMKFVTIDLFVQAAWPAAPTATTVAALFAKKGLALGADPQVTQTADGWLLLDPALEALYRLTYDEAQARLAVAEILQFRVVSAALPEGYFIRLEQTATRGTELALYGPTRQLPAQARTRWKEAALLRTQQLAPHNLIATPLPGSLQALVFRHPAAFAATASAVNQTIGQYLGQSVTLERRIANFDVLTNQYKAFLDKVTGMDWQTYQPHGREERGAPIALLPAPTDPAAPDKLPAPLEIVAGSEIGIYGADRYVYPDLPLHYQYRVNVFSRAGAIQSDQAKSSWIAPLFDAARRPPGVLACRHVTYQAQRLTLQIPLIHHLYHLPADLRRLWVHAETTLSLDGDAAGNGAAVAYGNLPDLALSYHLLLQVAAATVSTQAILIPLLQIKGPQRSNTGWFHGETRNDGVKFHGNDTGQAAAEITVITLDRQLFMELNLVIDSTNPAGANVDNALKALTNLSTGIGVITEHSGVFSPFAFGKTVEEENNGE